jgi:hypothetical protein
MSYVLSGKLEVPKNKDGTNQNPNFNSNFGEQETDEKAEDAAGVILEMWLMSNTIVEAVLRDESREVKRYKRMERKK